MLLRHTAKPKTLFLKYNFLPKDDPYRHGPSPYVTQAQYGCGCKISPPYITPFPSFSHADAKATLNYYNRYSIKFVMHTMSVSWQSQRRPLYVSAINYQTVVTWVRVNSLSVFAIQNAHHRPLAIHACLPMLLVAENQLHRWVKRGNLVDSRTSVTDVKFGPKHLGLILVSSAVIDKFQQCMFIDWSRATAVN